VTRTVPTRTTTSKAIVNPPQMDLSRTLATGLRRHCRYRWQEVRKPQIGAVPITTVLLILVKKRTLRAAFHRGAPQIDLFWGAGSGGSEAVAYMKVGR
jgi:hypothetical protein